MNGRDTYFSSRPFRRKTEEGSRESDILGHSKDMIRERMSPKEVMIE